MKLENFDSTGLPISYSPYAAPDLANHGNSGPIHNCLPKNPIPGITTFIDGCVEAGIPKSLDLNSGKIVRPSPSFEFTSRKYATSTPFWHLRTRS